MGDSLMSYAAGCLTTLIVIAVCIAVYSWVKTDREKQMKRWAKQMRLIVQNEVRADRETQAQRLSNELQSVVRQSLEEALISREDPEIEPIPFKYGAYKDVIDRMRSGWRIESITSFSEGSFVAFMRRNPEDRMPMRSRLNLFLAGLEEARKRGVVNGRPIA